MDRVLELPFYARAVSARLTLNVRIFKVKKIEIKVGGEVQGVFFRQGVKEIAEKLSLTGWVSNEQDGSVKIVAEGEEENLQKLIDWCRKGTSRARVEKVMTRWEETEGEFQYFEVR